MDFNLKRWRFLNRESRNACAGSGSAANRAPSPILAASAWTVSREVFASAAEYLDASSVIRSDADAGDFPAGPPLACLYILVVPCVASTAAHPSATSTLIPDRSPATSPPPKVTE